jgi:hypothetical protein
MTRGTVGRFHIWLPGWEKGAIVVQTKPEVVVKVCISLLNCGGSAFLFHQLKEGLLLYGVR